MSKDRRPTTRSGPPPRRRTRRSAKPTHSYTDAKRGVRLQKVLAEAGIASRRACEELIEEGVVAVNGEPVCEMPAWVDPTTDQITVNDRPITRKRRHIYVMLFKPRGTVSTNSDPEGRRRAIDLVQHPAKARLYPVGRLDVESSGLLLLTNDGELANRLTHPRYGVHKGYEVTIGGRLADEDVAKLEAGIFLAPKKRNDAEVVAGARRARSKLTIIKRDRDKTLLYMELREGRNRQIRRMLARLGYPIKKLRRVKIGPLALKGLSAGEWRELTVGELRSLRAAASRSEKRLKATGRAD